MTRANINFISQKQGGAPRTLFFYWNGDQYPTGIRDSYNLLDFVQGEMTAKRFKEWAGKNYSYQDKPMEVEDLGEGGQPKVYFTDGFITDYSYVFDAGCNPLRDARITVWNWDESIFKGNQKEFIEWLKAQK